MLYKYGISGILGFSYDSKNYTYRKSLQGDITDIVDDSGKVVAYYDYDAYGNQRIYGYHDNEWLLLEDTLTHEGVYANSTMQMQLPCLLSDKDTLKSNHIAYINPFRYRSYYYDTETNLYYLTSRYYDPETGRFINADDLSYADPETINGLNLFAYCLNNPIANIDPSGHAWYDIFAWISVGLFASALTIVTLGAAGIAIGGITGGIIMGAAIGTLVLGTAGAATGAIGGMIYDAVNGNDFGTSIWKWTKTGFGLGAIAGAAIGGAIGGLAGASLAGSNNLMLWTGLGKNGAAIASSEATKLGLTTIGQTFGGKVINMFPNVLANKMWIWAPKLAVSTAKMSSINVLTGATIGARSVYMLFENPILLQRSIKIIRNIFGG